MHPDESDFSLNSYDNLPPAFLPSVCGLLVTVRFRGMQKELQPVTHRGGTSIILGDASSCGTSWWRREKLLG